FAQSPPRIERGTLIYEGIPDTGEADQADLQRYLEARSAGLAGWLADGSLLISTRFGNTAQLHRVRAPLGMREQMTFEAEPVASAIPNPRSADLVVYEKDVGGNEAMQLHLFDLRTGASKLLTDGKSLHGTPMWAHDGRRIAYHGTGRDGASFDIYVRDTTTDEPARLVLPATGGDEFDVLDWSLDDRQLLVLRYRSSLDSALLLVDIDTGLQTPLAPGPKDKPPFAIGAARFAPDFRSVYVVSDNGGEHMELRRIDVYSGESTVLAPQPRWDIDLFEMSPDGRYLAYTINEAGFSRLVLHDTQQQADVLLPALPAGALISDMKFDGSGKQLALQIDSAQSPADIFVLTISDQQPPQLVRWTQSEIGPVNREAMVAAELIEFPTWDKVNNQFRMLSAFVYRPRTAGPHPVLIDIHGGPESQYRPHWSAYTQYLVNELGYAVVAPNVRGSSGYGRSFLALDDGVLREDSVRDIGSLLVWIGLQTDLNRDRVAVYGGSYGGYMALASMVHYGDRLAGGIDVVGISDFVTFLENTSAYRRDLRRAEYGDERDEKMREFLKRISPLTSANAIRKPLLVVQGLNDPRVPAAESEQMVQKLRLQGGTVWYLAAKDEGHGFRKKGNRDAYLAAMAQFLKQLK
ncbi:MAG: S9 family peptidase, partial [Nevskiaceae bacterium]|nr:S9 family peptidase [Nevskiaceae bacterium]